MADPASPQRTAPHPRRHPGDDVRISEPNATGRPFIRQRASGPYWYAKWSRNGERVVRALGRAWVEPDGKGGWRPNRGRPPADRLTHAQAAEKMLQLVKAHHSEQTAIEQDAEECQRRGITFRDLARGYLRWFSDVKNTKPIYTYALMKPDLYGLTVNPAARTDHRREPQLAPVAFFSVEQVEALARALAARPSRRNLPFAPRPRRGPPRLTLPRCHRR
jgi:hypothetical protein